MRAGRCCALLLPDKGALPERQTSPECRGQNDVRLLLSQAVDCQPTNVGLESIRMCLTGAAYCGALCFIPVPVLFAWPSCCCSSSSPPCLPAYLPACVPAAPAAPPHLALPLRLAARPPPPPRCRPLARGRSAGGRRPRSRALQGGWAARWLRMCEAGVMGWAGCRARCRSKACRCLLQPPPPPFSRGRPRSRGRKLVDRQARHYCSFACRQAGHARSHAEPSLALTRVEHQEVLQV